uniref:Uncharacterized protein n=1 Tax=Myotis myotis TaxID=51298 RepID=A0A7J7TJ43_MYOMY|nr:hypothetical protein mMyoMyo1_009018 [Myotis myotis]
MEEAGIRAPSAASPVLSRHRTRPTPGSLGGHCRDPFSRRKAEALIGERERETHRWVDSCMLPAWGWGLNLQPRHLSVVYPSRSQALPQAEGRGPAEGGAPVHPAAAAARRRQGHTAQRALERAPGRLAPWPRSAASASRSRLPGPLCSGLGLGGEAASIPQRRPRASAARRRMGAACREFQELPRGQEWKAGER